MDYQACLEYVSRNCTRNIPGGFERTKRLAELAGSPQETLQIIHIAGTNGKGSTASAIASVLQQAGYRTGLFTSPHLECYEERIRINGELISQEAFAEIFTWLIEQAVPVLLEEGMHHPGEFELLTAAGWIYFKDKTDFVISEVGLGGTLDPTNVITKPVLTVITPVSLDHCQILGNTVSEIAREKAGILKAEVPLVLAPQHPDACAAICERADNLHVPVTVLQESEIQKQPLKTAMQGSYQQMNCHTALAAVKNLRARGYLHITDEQIKKGLETAFWPGRMEYLDLGENRSILLDGAHNPAGISSLTENLRMLYAEKELILFLSILDDKEQFQMLKEILPYASAVVLTHPAYNSRAQNWKALQEWVTELVPDCPCRMYDDYQEGLKQEMAALQPGQMLCITGSLYLLGDCRKLLHAYL